MRPFVTTWRIFVICMVIFVIGPDAVKLASISLPHEVTKTTEIPDTSSDKKNEKEKQDEMMKENEIPLDAFDEEDDPLLSDDYFEGDIVGINISDVAGRNAILDVGKLWEDGVIPYKLPPFLFTRRERNVIEDAMNEYHKNTCIRFVEKSNEENFINFIKGRGCYSNVGRKSGRQELSLGSGCIKKGIVMHELMHGVGFWHEQSRADRDEFIKIIWNNIKKGSEHNFNKYPWTEIQHLEESYDINSIMHYGPNSFARARWQKTIEPKQATDDDFMGQRERFTDIDIRKLNKLYKCSSKTSTTLRTGQGQHNNILGSLLSLPKRFVEEILQQRRENAIRQLILQRRMLRRRKRPIMYY